MSDRVREWDSEIVREWRVREWERESERVRDRGWEGNKELGRFCCGELLMDVPSSWLLVLATGACFIRKKQENKLIEDIHAKKIIKKEKVDVISEMTCDFYIMKASVWDLWRYTCKENNWGGRNSYECKKHSLL